MDKYAMSVEDNIFCAKRILVDSIYSQANLEGICVTFAETQDILNDVNVDNVKPKDMSKVFCLRDGWEFTLNNLDAPLDLVFLEDLHSLIARFDVDYRWLGVLRTDDVMISGTLWRPDIPDADRILGTIQDLNSIECETDRAIELGLFLMHAQIFKDGNKRIGSFVMNKELIKCGRGLFKVPVELDGTFKQMLVDYYESGNSEDLKSWIYDNCLIGTTLAESNVF